ncbi:integral membrane protein [Colletotrichum tofieldiae]|uniref:Integral membrane protein n=1 Tax=Colletotrichum tofieldiae TaxID=708197 RepID=A0A161VY33_9PEZI|nr:integral membrane protein [Colletotrichum tofieldiae]GKT56589.1 integral membrane protein [Colletotrichum tofieldiae]GKT76442.1 integral membrane protein [Colletotrichum tofieldiae]GKT87488.1 integral membrane protein [Colletotrichum tofieldiae]
MADSIKGAVDLTRSEAMAVAALATTGIYSAIEIYILVFTTFRQRRGRYFWSMIVANSGIFVHAIVSLVRFLARSGTVVPAAFALLAWCAMVTGQSVVLWSRLHLVVYSRTWIRSVLVIIVTNACALHVPMMVLWVLCWAAPVQEQAAWLRRYGVYEKVSIVMFTLQETFITGIFARQGLFNLRPLFAFKTRTARLISWYLLSLFVLVFLLDAGLIILEYTNNFIYQTTSKPLVYSIKLKVEFTVLNKLLAFTKMNSCDCHHLDDSPEVYSKGLMTTDTTATTKGLTQAQRTAQSGELMMVPEIERPDHIFDGSYGEGERQQNLR